MIKVTAKPKASWNTKEIFSLGISIGSLNHEGEALESIINKLNQGGFSLGVIDLSDTLNRYKHICCGLDEQTATVKAMIEGQEWLKRNKDILDKLNMPFKIHKWEEWLNHSDYAKRRKLFENLYKESEELRSAIHHDVQSYYKRVHNIDMPPKHLEAISRNYYLEELTAHSLIFDKYQATSVYPGKQLECFKVIRNGLIKDAPRALKNSPYTRLILHAVPSQEGFKAA